MRILVSRKYKNKYPCGCVDLCQVSINRTAREQPSLLVKKRKENEKERKGRSKHRRAQEKTQNKLTRVILVTYVNYVPPAVFTGPINL